MLNANERRRIKQYLQDHSDDMVAMTQTLCAIATENPPGSHYKDCVEYLAKVMEEEGCSPKVIKTPQAYQEQFGPENSREYPRYNLISRWETAGGQTLHFNSHYDVVPATDGWKTAPFDPQIKGKRLYGRGTMDMKGCLVASIFAMKALKACGLKPRWNIEYSFVADEEVGGACGTGYLIREKNLKPDAAVVCEGGMGSHIMFGHRGVLWANVLVEGVSAHGSNPAGGVNAFEKGIALAQKFLSLHRKHAKKKSRYPMDHEAFLRPTLNLGGVSGGGSKINIVPAEFAFTLDRRILPEENPQQIQKHYREIIESAMENDPQMNARIEFDQAYAGGLTAPTHQLCQIAQEAVKAVYRKEARLHIFGAFTDLHFFTNFARCPAIGYGVEGAGLHSNQEYLIINSLPKTAQVYAEIAMRL